LQRTFNVSQIAVPASIENLKITPVHKKRNKIMNKIIHDEISKNKKTKLKSISKLKLN